MPATSTRMLEQQALLREKLQTPEGRSSAIVPLARSIRRSIEQRVHLRYQQLDGERKGEWGESYFTYALVANATLVPGMTIIQQEVELMLHRSLEEFRTLLDPQIGFNATLQLLDEMVTQLRGALQFRETLTPDGSHLVEEFDRSLMQWTPFHEPTKEPQ